MPKVYISPQDKELLNPKFRSLYFLDRYRNLCLWLPVKIASKSLPWGYKVDPTDSKIAIPDPHALDCFIRAIDFLKEHSYSVVSAWLTNEGYPITDDGLKLMFHERPNWPEIHLSYEERLKL